MELAHSLCAKTVVTTNRQMPDNNVLIVPGVTGMHRHGNSEVYSRIGKETKDSIEIPRNRNEGRFKMEEFYKKLGEFSNIVSVFKKTKHSNSLFNKN